MPTGPLTIVIIRHFNVAKILNSNPFLIERIMDEMEVPSVEPIKSDLAPSAVDSSESENSKDKAALARERRKAKILGSSGARIKYIVGTSDTPIATPEEQLKQNPQKPAPYRTRIFYRIQTS
jgi:hypothetical protein